MVIREYIFQKLVLTPSNLGYLSNFLADTMADTMKDSIMQTLQDEKLAGNIALYADTLVDRELKRFWGSVGGVQKGINFSTKQNNPLTDLITEDGGINLSGVINMLARNWAQNRSPISQIPQNTREIRSNAKIVPEMTPI